MCVSGSTRTRDQTVASAPRNTFVGLGRDPRALVTGTRSESFSQHGSTTKALKFVPGAAVAPGTPLRARTRHTVRPSVGPSAAPPARRQRGALPSPPTLGTYRLASLRARRAPPRGKALTVTELCKTPREWLHLFRATVRGASPAGGGQRVVGRVGGRDGLLRCVWRRAPRRRRVCGRRGRGRGTARGRAA